MAQTNPTLRFRRAARGVAGLSTGRTYHYPVEVIEGYSPPRLVGRSYYYTTPSGKTIVHHPGAYGWRTLYHPSTCRVVVGSKSLFALAWAAIGAEV
jgi:hypothetical protein